jgi:hypothetical protein
MWWGDEDDGRREEGRGERGEERGGVARMRYDFEGYEKWGVPRLPAA